jgi:mRNA-degrading endonuclease toxin of MazEF toxin-antitoxin module
MPSKLSFGRGDIVLISLDPTSGHEQAGYRPVLVISPREVNDLMGTAIVLPITTGGNFARVQGFTVPLDDAGITTEGVVLCHQPRALDLVARGARGVVESVPDVVLSDVLARFISLFEDAL